MMEIELLGAMAIWEVRLNAVSVVNLLMGIGVFISKKTQTSKFTSKQTYFISFHFKFHFQIVFTTNKKSTNNKIGFCVHIAYAYTRSTGTKDQKAYRALVEMSSSVLQGITATKLVGVIVLGLSQSLIFRVC